MSLTAVTVSETDFDHIWHHLVNHKAGYRCMHLREACQRDRQRDLRYLHAMHAPAGQNKIDGVISGPGVFWRYSLARAAAGRRTQLNVFSEIGSERALERMGRRFMAEIIARIRLEQSGQTFNPRRLPGQYYLRRREAGTLATHPTCVRAVAGGVLAQEFVEVLAPWRLELLRP